jgi:hypothetical protein
MRMFFALLICFLFSCGATVCFSGTPIPSHVLRGVGVSVPAVPCKTAISLSDSAGKTYCFICAEYSGRILIRMMKEILTAGEIKEIADRVERETNK